MLEGEKFAIAAHLHVVLRRVNGRVTDVEWMVKSPEYAKEVVRVARLESNPDLLGLADKLEAALCPPAPRAPKPAAQSAAGPSTLTGAEPSGFLGSSFDPSSPTGRKQRYIGSLR